MANAPMVYRAFFSLHGKSILGLSFLAISLVSVPRRRSYPMTIEQIVRCEISSNPSASPIHETAGTRLIVQF